jgi:hypothetical protein
MRTDDFFAFARERHSIHLRRRAGLPRSAWTDDPILQTYRFTNIFRELDRTTVWFREHVRDPMRGRPEVLLATVLFRWFNRIQTGEAIFVQQDLIGCVGGCTAWESLWNFRDAPGAALADVRRAISAYCGSGPYVTGAYIIKTPDGKNKLDGVLWCVEQFMNRGYSFPGTGYLRGEHLKFEQSDAACAMIACTRSGESMALETVWGWLRQFPFLGDFMAYEIVTDLRHTALLDRAPDIMTWANPGPGATRGLNRLHGRPLNQRVPRPQLIHEMQQLLACSADPRQWPRDEGWPSWEMRDVEHTLCEADKYWRVQSGDGKPKQRYWG